MIGPFELLAGCEIIALRSYTLEIVRVVLITEQNDRIHGVNDTLSGRDSPMPCLIRVRKAS
jgi:hypothetical protein